MRWAAGSVVFKKWFSATECVSLDLTIVSRNPAHFIDLNPAVASTFRSDLSALLRAILA